jgi:hypothetical protein
MEMANGSRGLSDLNNDPCHFNHFVNQFNLAYEKSLGGMVTNHLPNKKTYP